MAIEELRASLATLLSKTLIRVDEHPVLTRFWTFRDAIDAMLLTLLLGVSEDVFRVSTKKLREKSSKRLTAVHNFFSAPGAAQYLRRTSLCLRITGVATVTT